MTEATFDGIVTTNTKNVRKALKGGVLIAPEGTALPTALTAMSTGDTPAPQLQELTGWSSFGLISDDGAVHAQDVSQSSIQAWGKGSPVRTDVSSRTRTLHIVGLETNKTTLASYFNVDPATLVPDETTGELVITDTGDLSTTYYRVLVLSQDGAAGSETWTGQLLPRASITDYGDMTMMSGDTAVEYDMTFTAYADDDAGFTMKEFLAGPGWLAGLATAGFGSGSGS